MKISLLSPYRYIGMDVVDLPAFRKDGNYPLVPFDEQTLNFFDLFSKSILSSKEINRLPEIASLAFWLRKANINKMRSENLHLFNNSIYKTSPRGVVFHICPANVDTMFIYSLAVAVLMGNKNILRLSARMSAPHINKLFELMNQLLSSHSIFEEYINVIRYDHDDMVSSFLSEKAAVRIIWGGDQTIAKFKEIKSAPKTKDVVFSDKISILCIKSEELLKMSDEKEKEFCRDFYNDSYTFDQKGCSSPQSIFFIGQEDANLKCIEKISTVISQYAAASYEADIASIASLKLNHIVDEAMEDGSVSLKGNAVATFMIRDTHSTELKHTCGGGIFNIQCIDSVMALKDYVIPKLQTISYFGFSEKDIEELQTISNGEGIERIVPVGSALNFYYIWDGYNLFEELSKKIYIKK